MENFVPSYILGFCDYLDKTGDYEFADRIMSKISNPLQENIRIASKKLYTQEQVLQKLISYRLAADEVSPSIIRDIDSIGETPKTPEKSSGKKVLWARFISALIEKFPKFANTLSKFKNFGGPVITAIFAVPQAIYWIKKILNEGWAEAFDSGKEVSEFVSAISAIVGTISAFAAAGSAAPTAGLGGLTFGTISAVLFGVSAAAYVLTWILPDEDDPTDKIPNKNKPKKEEAKPSEAPKQNTSTPPSKPSTPSSKPSAPSAPRRQPSKPAENDSDKIWYDKVNKNIKDIVFD
jgi:hypothetical protein